MCVEMINVAEKKIVKTNRDLIKSHPIFFSTYIP